MVRGDDTVMRYGDIIDFSARKRFRNGFSLTVTVWGDINVKGEVIISKRRTK